MRSLLKYLEEFDSVKTVAEHIGKKLQVVLDRQYPPLLVLMNLNGILLYRETKDIFFNEPKYSHWYGQRAYMRKLTSGRNKARIYLREGSMEFLTKLIRHPRI